MNTEIEKKKKNKSDLRVKRRTCYNKFDFKFDEARNTSASASDLDQMTDISSLRMIG